MAARPESLRRILDVVAGNPGPKTGSGLHCFILTGVRHSDPTDGPVLAWNFVKDDADRVRTYPHDLGIRCCRAREQLTLLFLGRRGRVMNLDDWHLPILA